MKYIDIREASLRWGISDRRIRLLCSEGRIDGAIKLGWSWILPDETLKRLEKDYGFCYQERVDAQHSAVRFCTSWGTKEENVDRLIHDLKEGS